MNRKKNIILLIITAICFMSIRDIEARSMFIKDMSVQARAHENGDLYVKETMVFRMNGEWNGLFYSINTEDTDGLTGLKVYLQVDNELVLLEESSNESPRTYTKTVEQNSNNFKLFLPSENEDITIVFEYTLINMVKIYNDMALIDRKFIGDEETNLIEKLNVDIYFPEHETIEDVLVFADAPLNGEITRVSTSQAHFYIENLEPGFYVLPKIVLENKYFPNSTNLYDYNYKDDFLNNEALMADEANLSREEAINYIAKEKETRKNTIISSVFIIAVMIIIEIINKIFKRRKINVINNLVDEIADSNNFHFDYYREIPNKYSPAFYILLLDIIKISDKGKKMNLDPNSILAVLLNLVCDGYLTMEENPRLANIDKDYIFKLNKEKDFSKLSIHEDYLLNWLFNDIAIDGSLSLLEVEDYPSSESRAKRFLDKKKAFLKYVKNDYEDYGFESFSDSMKTYNSIKQSLKFETIKSIVTIMIYIGLFVFLKTKLLTLMPFVLLLFGIMSTAISLFAYTHKANKNIFTTFGEEEFLKSYGLYTFLDEFSSLDNVEMPSIILWEKYLVFATAIGIAEKVVDEFNERFPNVNLDEYQSYRIPRSLYLHGSSHRMFDTKKSYFNRASNLASTKMASSSGSGGGSSGGGFGSSGGSGGGSSRGGF